eukprot:13876739-Alexandrium_andersonii.AAC.1
MSASLVGSEMCIRDSLRALLRCPSLRLLRAARARLLTRYRHLRCCPRPCLLYTSDAADDM